MNFPAKFGKYTLLEQISVGGMAEVFKAKSRGVEGFEKLIAIKRILKNIVESDPDFIDMFIDEAKISVQLNHANICQVYDLGKIDENFFIAMEYVQGKDLHSIWKLHKQKNLILPIPISVYIASRVCDGLDYAHRKTDSSGQALHVIHRDVSPQNILVSYEGEIKIIDFGIAKAANRVSQTKVGILKGKYAYMSPEQVRGLPLDQRSDIFAVGITLYECLTGERLFATNSDFETLEKVRRVEIVPPSAYNADIPIGLEEVVLKALSKDPDERFFSSYEMQEQLQNFLSFDNTTFSRKHLSNYMKKAFKTDIGREQERDRAHEKLSLPDGPPEAENSSPPTPEVPFVPLPEIQPIAPKEEVPRIAFWKTPWVWIVILGLMVLVLGIFGIISLT